MVTKLIEMFFPPPPPPTPSEIALAQLAMRQLPPGVEIKRIWVNGDPVTLDAWLAQQRLPMVTREEAWPPPAIDNWIARSTPAEYELPELVAERRSKVRGRNGIVLRARRFAARHNEGIREGLFWAALLCVLVMLGGLYLILENLGWFRL